MIFQLVLPLAPLCFLQWVPGQELQALAISGLMGTGFGMEEVIPGGMGIGQIRRMGINGSPVTGEKNREATIGNPDAGANAVSSKNGH